jgi:hypothetical protein
MTRRFVKHYRDAAARQLAEANYRWLAALPGPARFPALLAVTEADLFFEHVDGRHARPEDLTVLAAHLGDVHGSAYAAELRRARLGQAHRTPAGHTVAGFPDRRMTAVARELETGNAPGATLTAAQAQHLLASADGPAAFYKDANPRNFLITPDGEPVTVDFDELTLAPFGYDLAKLTVTLAMTHGPLPAGAVASALSAYNDATARHDPSLPSVTKGNLMNWAEIHYILTSRHAAGGRYPCPWNQARPA